MKRIIFLMMAMVLALSLGLVPATPVAAGDPDPPGIVGLWHLNEGAGGAGTVTADVSGSGNHGTLIGPVVATWVPSMPVFGSALQCSSGNYAVRVPDSPSLDISTGLVLEAWVKFDSFTERSRVVGKVDSAGTQNSYMLQVGTDGKVGFSVWKSPAETTFLMGDTILNPGQWYHIMAGYVYVGDGTSVMRILVSGAIDGGRNDAVGPISVGSADLLIGRLDGTIDEVHVWNNGWVLYDISVSPRADVNPVMTEHQITATVRAIRASDGLPGPVAPGVRVRFRVMSGPNYSDNASVGTGGSGVAAWSYLGDGGGGLDIIAVGIGLDFPGGPLAGPHDIWVLPPVIKYWWAKDIQYRWSTLPGHPPRYQWDPYPTIFKSWNQVYFFNEGPGQALNVTATITCTPVNVTILPEKGTVHFGNIPAKTGKWCYDDYALSTDMTPPLPPANKNIVWRVEWDDTAGNHHVFNNVPQFLGKPINCP